MNEAKETKTAPYIKLTFIAALVVTIGLGLWFFRDQQQRIHGEVISDLAAVARLKIGQIEQWRNERLGDGNVLSEDLLFRAKLKSWLLNSGVNEEETIRTRLASVLTHCGYVKALIADSKGRVLFSLKKNSSIAGGLEKEHFREAISSDKVTLSDFYVSEDGTPKISVIVPIEELNIFVVLVYDPTLVLYPLIKTWPTPRLTAETLLVRKEGNRVLFLNDLLHKEDAALKFEIPLSNLNLPATKAILGNTGPVVGKDYRQVEVIAWLQAIPSTSWFMVAKVDTVEAFAAWRSRAALMVSLLIGLVVLLITLVYLRFQRTERNFFEDLYRVEASLRKKESRFRVILQSIGDAVIATDGNGDVELLNPVAEQLTGWKTEQAKGKGLTEVFDIKNAKTGSKAENPVEKVLKEGKTVGLANHTALTSRQGEVRSIADSAAPIIDEKGVLSGVVLVFRDVTEKEKQAEAIREQKRMLNETGRLAKIGGWEHDLTTGRALWTKALYDIVELDRASEPSVVEEHLSYYPPEDRELLKQAYDNSINNRVPFDIELKARTAKGKNIWCRVAGEPIIVDDKCVRLVGTLQDITEKKNTEIALNESERQLSTLMSNLPGMVYRCKNEADWPMEFVSQGVREITGYEPEDFTKNKVSFGELIHPDFRDDVYRKVQAAIKKGHFYELTYQILHKDGLLRWVWERGQLVTGQNGEARLEGFITDISEQKEMETVSAQLQEQLVQSQKMEAIGRLAGGVAHDFNNMLLVILGNVDCLMEDLPVDSPLLDDLKDIEDAAERSSALTKQLLAFARRQAAEPVVLDVNKTMGNMSSMLKRLIGEDVVLNWRPGEDVWPICIDPSQLDQLLANLCINARQAIAGTGEVIIETSNRTFDDDEIEPNSPKGDFVQITVSDTGCGMDEETKAKAFEPFFSTKAHDGTGLGLATVYGIVKQNNGHIHIYSELEHGTSFKVLLPRSLTDEVRDAPRETQLEMPRGNGETILLVEDETAVANLSQRTLENLGYRVFSVTNPLDAIEVVDEQERKFDLLITDVIMPGINGRELRERIEKYIPGIEVIYISGYTADIIAKRGVIEKGMYFLAKPFSRRSLANIVHKVLYKKKRLPKEPLSSD